MRTVKQKRLLHVDNLNIDSKLDKNHRHNELFPSTIRCIICGPSNCGKTNTMATLLLNKNGLRFENVYIYCKSLFQPVYRFIEDVMKPIKHMGFFKFDHDEDILHPSAVKNNSIFIFDDVACDKQSVIRDYFSMGRHNLIDCFYLCQTYTHIPKHLIRDNANFIIIFRQDEMNLKHIHSDHVNPDMDFNRFIDLCRECWQEKYGFLVICKDDNIKNGRYRQGFDNYIKL